MSRLRLGDEQSVSKWDLGLFVSEERMASPIEVRRLALRMLVVEETLRLHSVEEFRRLGDLDDDGVNSTRKDAVSGRMSLYAICFP